MFEGCLDHFRGVMQENPTCGYSDCAHNSDSSVSPLMTCAACGILQYCSKECQRKDWKRHKALCVSCRPFKSYSDNMDPSVKLALDEYSRIQLPSILEEYFRKYDNDPTLLFFFASSLSGTEKMILSNIPNLSKEESNPNDLAKRWQEVSPALWDFLDDAKPGDIFVGKSYNPYAPTAPQQFRNTPLSEKMKLESGKTLVDIGFVDFGMTFDSIYTLEPEGEPLTVVAYDAAPLCVAKSIVMTRMMKDAKVKARSIVEVWLSSLWSEETLQAFRMAASDILGSHDEVQTPVKRILKFWLKTPKISRKAALDFQLEGVFMDTSATFLMKCCALKEEPDRVEFLRYHVTKALYEDDTTVVGSPIMGNNEDMIGVKQMFASCIEAVPDYILMDCREDYISGETFMGRIKVYFERSIQTLMDHLRKGSLVFKPTLGTLSPDNVALIEEIKNLDPFLIHWSNVVDYIDPRDFHSIAKEISGCDTVHIFHSCNWTSRVMGTDVYDINPNLRLCFYSHGLMTTRMSASMMECVTPNPPKHFRDVCSLLLSRKYIKHFLRYFFRGEDVSCACVNGNTPLRLPNPFARSDVTAHLFFAYKEANINFGVDSFDFNTDDE